MKPIDRCRKIVRECEEAINTVEWWNQNRTDAPPMDCEPERVLLPVAKACLAAWESGDSIKAERLASKMVKLCEAVAENG